MRCVCLFWTMNAESESVNTYCMEICIRYNNRIDNFEIVKGEKRKTRCHHIKSISQCFLLRWLFIKHTMRHWVHWRNFYTHLHAHNRDFFSFSAFFSARNSTLIHFMLISNINRAYNTQKENSLNRRLQTQHILQKQCSKMSSSSSQCQALLLFQ